MNWIKGWWINEWTELKDDEWMKQLTELKDYGWMNQLN